MENQYVHDRASSVENVTVGGPMREYLTEKEVDRLIEAAKGNRWGHRDVTAILIAYRHGLRASELVALRSSDIELQPGRLHVRRAKGGTASVHPVSAREPGIAPAATGVPGLALYLHLRTWGAAQRRRLSADGCPRWRGRQVWLS